jgi:signal transduction histidine kinase
MSGTTASNSPGPSTIMRNYPLLLKRMERLMEVSRTLASTLELGRLLRIVIETAKELTDSEAASIMLFDPLTGDLRFEDATNFESIELQGIIVPVEGSIAGWIVTHSEPLVVPDTSRDPRWSQKVDRQTLFVTRSILGVPLLTPDKTLGAVEAINKRHGTYSQDDTQVMQMLASQASVAIVNARLFQQSDLISEMVHELRTPLASLTAASHLLSRPELPEGRRRDLLRTLQQETQRLTNMTTDFLDLARLESGRARFARAPFDMAELASECLEVIRPQAGTRGLRLEFEAEGTPTMVDSDRSKVKQVLLNLLTNAVKYNRENGSIAVRVQWVEGGHSCRVHVADTGRGIPPEAMKRMFEKFYRVPDSEGYATGTGLGLSIAKRIIEALGGAIGVESVVGEGSTFYFTLPRSVAPTTLV